MAEFLGQEVEQDPVVEDGFANMGKPIPKFRRQAGYEHCKAMGLNSEHAWCAVNGVAEQLERDKPYEAMAKGMKYLDLTGVYRLFAVLLVTPEIKPAESPVSKAVRGAFS